MTVVLLQPPDIPYRQPACAWPHRPQFWRPPHHHGEIEFNLVHAGHAVFDVGGRHIDVGAGALVWLLPGVHHSLVSCSQDFDMWVAAFRPEWVDAVAGGAEGSDLRAVLASVGGLMTVDPAATASIADRCRAAFGNQNRNGEAMASALVHAARAFRRASTARTLGSRAAREIRIDPSLERDDLARSLRVGASTLARAFKSEIGVTIPEFRARIKLQKALSLLEEGEGNLLHIAHSAGFGSYAQFHRILTAMTGVSPRELAKGAARSRLLAAVAPPEGRGVDRWSHVAGDTPS
jgi:AraC-like DNA-binding protein